MPAEQDDDLLDDGADDLSAGQGDDLGRGETGSGPTTGFDAHRALDQGDGEAGDLGGSTDLNRALDQGDGDPALLPDSTDTQ